MLHRAGPIAQSKPPRPITLSRPYRGAIDPTALPNAAAALSIPTANGHGAMHPDVIDMGASGWEGHRYWMAFTPYNGTSDTETPSIVTASSLTSGGTWAVPSGYTNPAAPDPGGTDHHADTDLIYDSATDRLYMFYVTTNEASYQDIRSRWTDGSGTWSSENTVLAGALDAYTNPSVIKVGSNWRMYYTGDLGALDQVSYRESSTPDSGYGSAVSCTASLDFGVYERKMQNINVIKDTDGTIVLVIGDGHANGNAGSLMFARSTDGGTTFQLTGPPVISLRGGSTAWDAGGIYRSSVLVDQTGTVVIDSGMIHVWYSAYKTDLLWGTGYVQLPVEVIRF